MRVRGRMRGMEGKGENEGEVGAESEGEVSSIAWEERDDDSEGGGINHLGNSAHHPRRRARHTGHHNIAGPYVLGEFVAIGCKNQTIAVDTISVFLFGTWLVQNIKRDKISKKTRIIQCISV